MKSLKTVLLSLVGLLVVAIAGVLAFAATKPDTFRVERSESIQAPAEKIFPLVNDFHQWTAWSPWEKMDPNMKRTYSGPASGEGAVYEWAGDSHTGKGRMEIVESVPPSKIGIKLTFIEPFAAENAGTWSFEPDGTGTKVTWAMEGRNQFIGKVFSVFMDMDAMIGKDFETGLANMKALAEK